VDSDIRPKAADQLIEIARRIERDPSNPDHAADNMPLYNGMVTWYDEVYVPSKGVQRMSTTLGSASSKYPYHKGGNQFQSKNYQSGTSTAGPKTSNTAHPGSRYGAEQAAAATEWRPIEGTFNREVLRCERLFSISTTDGVKYPYTATKEQCKHCKRGVRFPAGEKSPCDDGMSRCYQGSCKRCAYYGHRQDQCHQYVATTPAGKASSNQAHVVMEGTNPY
jgi:hypothetical protein